MNYFKIYTNNRIYYFKVIKVRNQMKMKKIYF